MTTLVDEKTEKPEFKMTHGKDYVEKQVIYNYIFVILFIKMYSWYVNAKKTITYSTEITPAKNPKLAKLDDRDEYMFSNPEAEKEFKKNERKLVKERRDKYANRVISYLISFHLKKKKKKGKGKSKRSCFHWHPRTKTSGYHGYSKMVQKQTVSDSKKGHKYNGRKTCVTTGNK